MLKIFESLLCRITLLSRLDGRAELTITNKKDPTQPPFRHSYDWGQQQLWHRDLDTLVKATGAQEVNDESAA